MLVARRARRHRRRYVCGDRTVVASPFARQYVLRRRPVLCSYRGHPHAFSPYSAAVTLCTVCLRRDGGGIRQRLSSQSPLETQCLGLQRSAAQHQGASVSPLHLLLGLAQCGGVAALSRYPSWTGATAQSLRRQTSLRGHASQRGARALQMSRPNSTSRWQKSLLSCGGKIVRSCISTL